MVSAWLYDSYIRRKEFRPRRTYAGTPDILLRARNVSKQIVRVLACQEKETLRHKNNIETKKYRPSSVIKSYEPRH
jgi:hypothetical protein